MEKVGAWIKAIARIFSVIDNSWDTITFEVRKVMPQQVELPDEAEVEDEVQDKTQEPEQSNNPDGSERLHQSANAGG
jgi:hypothetical protein